MTEIIVYSQPKCRESETMAKAYSAVISSLNARAINLPIPRRTDLARFVDGSDTGTSDDSEEDIAAALPRKERDLRCADSPEARERMDPMSIP